MEYKELATKQNLFAIIIIIKMLAIGLTWPDVGLSLIIYAMIFAEKLLGEKYITAPDVLATVSEIRQSHHDLAAKADELSRDVMGLKMRGGGR